MSQNVALRTYQKLIDDATTLLYESSETPRIDAEVLLQHAIEKPLAWLIAYGDSTATNEHLIEFYRLVELRQQGHPIAYIIGHKEFWSLDLIVNESVLIPRPDTEILVEQALERLIPNTTQQIIDLGTGSGAIALSLAKERPQSSVLATDSQTSALEVAKLNAESHRLTNVSFICSDWFTELVADQQFDLIASNPPYIESTDQHLTQGDLRFEPNSALVGSDDGLGDIRAIIEAAPNYLTNGGHLLIEHGYDQAESVKALLAAAGFNNITNYRDLNNLPRCTAANFTH